MFNKFADISSPSYKNLQNVHTNLILLINELSLNAQYLYEGLVFNDNGEQREYIYVFFYKIILDLITELTN